jgi:HTH-type transcriptional regulator, competence development regulator
LIHIQTIERTNDMKISIPKEWLLDRAHLEEGLEIGAGIPRHLPTPAPAPVAGSEDIATIEQRLPFGRFVTLMRRKRGWNVQQLAEKSETDAGEILVIENDPHYEAELSTVTGLAKSFGVPPGNLIKMAGLAEDRSMHLREEGLRFAASAESRAPLTEDEERALQTYLKVVLEDSDKK